MDERLSYHGTKKLPEYFSKNEIALILDTLRKSKDYWNEKKKSKIPKEWSDWLKMRDVCLIATIYILALRPKEGCSLRFDDFNLNYMTVKIRGENNKNRKDRVIPVPKILFTFYKEYFKFNRDRFWRGSQYLFPSFSNSPNPVSSGRLKYIFREKVLKVIGLWKMPIKAKAEFRTLYKLRHSRATHILNKQIEIKGKPDIFMLSNLLGHGDIRSTLVYLHTDEKYREYIRGETEI